VAVADGCAASVELSFFFGDFGGATGVSVATRAAVAGSSVIAVTVFDSGIGGVFLARLGELATSSSPEVWAPPELSKFMSGTDGVWAGADGGSPDVLVGVGVSDGGVGELRSPDGESNYNGVTWQRTPSATLG
jgi:hypothetical protein